MSRRAVPRARRSRPRAALSPSFYARDTEVVARELLGATLVCRTVEGTVAGRIVETEAYLGEHDLACHAAAGLTRRTAPLYGEPGTAYVYFVYGVHWCFNAVTRPAGQPSAVLIRAIEPLSGLALMRTRRSRARHDTDLCNGPGKVCAAFGIDGAFNGFSLQSPPLEILVGEPLADADITVTPRIGITRAVDWPLRWLVTGSEYVSRPRPGAAGSG